MEQENFDAKLAKLTHNIEQLDAKIDDKISSLREELRRWILEAYLLQARDMSVVYLDIGVAFSPTFSQACKRARNEVDKLSQEYAEMLNEISTEDFERRLVKFKTDVNRITRSAGLEQIWTV